MKPVEFFTLENFLWAQAGLVIIGAIYILKRNQHQGARLRWRTKSNQRGLPEEMNRPSEIWTGSSAPPRSRSDGHGGGERSLNIHFMHNGHSWDAYEALGLPAGADLARAVQAHKEALDRSDPTAKEFYDQALEAVRLHLK